MIDTLGLQTGNTVLSAYIVDNYPEHANEVITFYTVIINVGLLLTQFVSILVLIFPPKTAFSIHQSLVHLLLDRKLRLVPTLSASFKLCTEYSLNFAFRLYMGLCRTVHNMQLWSYSVVYSAADIRCRAKEYTTNVYQAYRWDADTVGWTIDGSGCVESR